MSCSISHNVPYASRATARSKSSRLSHTSSTHASSCSLRLLSIRSERGEFLRADDTRARYPRRVERAVAIRVRSAGAETRRERDRPCPSW